jgi:type VI protein secretion system component VasA
VINLFELDAEPIQTDAFQHDYRVRMPRSAGEHVEPYSAMTVIAVDHRSADKHHYVPFEEFQQIVVECSGTKRRNATSIREMPLGHPGRARCG